MVESVRNPLTGKISYRENEDRTGSFRVDLKTLVVYMSDMTFASKPKVKKAGK